MNRLGIIGHFGGGKKYLDGQTVKTKILYEELKANGYDNICIVDTYYNNTNRIKLLLDSLKCILSCRTIIILLSRNGLKVYLPMMYIAKKVFRCKIFHDVIGGHLDDCVTENPKYGKYLDSFDGNWVETRKLKERLEACGVNNCTLISNFKRLDISAAKTEISEDAKCSFCMFSRVMEEKGITEAIEAVDRYNRCSEKKIKLEIWGPVDDRYKEEFARLIDIYRESVSYMGTVNYDCSTQVLTNHLALLFPTHWSIEGFPGTVVDAYAAGLPVIASDMSSNSELIDNFRTGWVYPCEKLKTLDESIEWAIENTDALCGMRQSCLEKAEMFMPAAVMPAILSELKAKGRKNPKH